MHCPRCGAAASANARFCEACGGALGPPATALTMSAPDAATMAPAGPAHAADATRQPAPRSGPSSSGWLSSSDSISHGRFAPGALLDGRYRVIGLLGRGGMGEVYRADDLRLGQPVALKFLPEAVATDPVRLAQFHNEVRTARQVAHPNICRVYDIGEVQGQLFLSMEFVDGEDLSTSLRRIGRFPEDKATDIARQLCAGLAAAHERGVVHRDLKPANVMLDDNGKVRIMDFGLAAVGAVEEIRAGTPAYMAPEQLLGREVTARSDIYALGLVLYELFTGRRVFTAATLNDLVEQHHSGQVTPPSAVVSALDPAIERAILRCLDPVPARRPASALAVAASLPGGDPLAAALAAGETPSPEMVAAAGEGEGLTRRAAAILLAVALAGVAAVYAMGLRTSILEQIRPALNGDVLAQKAREHLATLGYTDRPQDEAYGFLWDEELVDQRDAKTPGSGDGDPSPLGFWYRRSREPLIGLHFHRDLLTPGIVNPEDPAPIRSGMIEVRLDHHGHLTRFEAIPPQLEEAPPAAAAAVDWRGLIALAGLDQAALAPAVPQWQWLAASDTRAAWTGTTPGSGGQSFRAEAAARHGRPVAFTMVYPWTTPWRGGAAAAADGSDVIAIVLFVLTLSVIVGGTVLARRNLREGRGDRPSAIKLAGLIGIALWIVWLCQVHVTVSIGILGVFLIAVCTTVFYGVLFWAIYLALEPFVRRYWPQTLVSWTTLLQGRLRDPIVGRDALIGVTLGVLVATLIRGTMFITTPQGAPPAELLLGVRSVLGMVVMTEVYAVRTALFFFFLLFLLRVLLRHEWAAALVFVSIFSVLNALDSSSPLIEGGTTFVYFSMVAFVVLRWGLTTLAVGAGVADLLMMIPATTDTSAWYFGVSLFVIALPIALAIWAFRVSLRGHLWEGAFAP